MGTARTPGTPPTSWAPGTARKSIPAHTPRPRRPSARIPGSKNLGWRASEYPNIPCATQESPIKSNAHRLFLLGCVLVSAASEAAPTVAPYGSWASPLSAEALAGGGISFGDLRSAHGRLYWTENVPARGGAI